MARVSKVSDGQKATPEQYNNLVDDYVSQTDTNAQTIASNLTISGNLIVSGSLAFGGKGLASGSSPITQAHGLTGVTSSNTIVFLCAMAAQPYTLSYSIDATNITIYHNAAGSLTISWFAFKIS